MSPTLAFIIFGISFALLLWSGKMLPRALGGIARILRISEFVAAFILVSIATSIPELFVGISSALQGVTTLSIGNVVGANVLNLTVVIGIPALVAGFIATDGKISRQNYWLISLIAFLPIFLILDGALSRIDGFILLTVFGLYLYKLFHDKEHFRKVLGDGDIKKILPPEEAIASLRKTIHHIANFIVGTALLLGSSFLLVWSSKVIVTEFFSADFLLFGIIFVALGTTLPELTFGIRAALDGYPQAMLGNALGSIAFNAAGVVGIAALIHPIKTGIDGEILIAAFFLFTAFLLFHFFAYTKNRLSRREGVVLLLLYGVFLFFVF